MGGCGLEKNQKNWQGTGAVGNGVLPATGGLTGLLGGKAVGILVSGTIALVGKATLGASVVGNSDGITMGVCVMVGVMVGVLLGGNVGVTKTNPDSTVICTC